MSLSFCWQCQNRSRDRRDCSRHCNHSGPERVGSKWRAHRMAASRCGNARRDRRRRFRVLAGSSLSRKDTVRVAVFAISGGRSAQRALLRKIRRAKHIFRPLLPGVRAFVPLLAGTLGMQVARFYVVNVISAAIWAPAHILPGMLFGVTFHALGPAAKPLGALLLTLFVLSWLLVRSLRYLMSRGLPYLQTLGEIVQERLSRRSDPVSRLVHQLLDPAGNELRIIAVLVLTMSAGTGCFWASWRTSFLEIRS